MQKIEVKEVPYKTSLKLKGIKRTFNNGRYTYIICDDAVYRTEVPIKIYREEATHNNANAISIFGKPLTAVELSFPDYDMVREIKDSYKVFHEFDVQQRIKILRLTKPEQYSMKFTIAYFDIETYKCHDVWETPEPVISCIIYSERTGYKSFILKNKNDIVEELNMIGEILTELSTYDIITAWYLPFDIGYLTQRRMKLRKLLNMPEAEHQHFKRRIKFDQEAQEPRLYVNSDFVALLDLKDLVKNNVDFARIATDSPALAAVPKNYALDEVSYVILGDRKLNILPWEAYDTDKDLLLKYNKKDVDLMVKIEKTVGIIRQKILDHKITGLNVDEIQSRTVVDIMLLKAFRRLVFPSTIRRKREHYKGAIVFNPIPGLHLNVKIVDVSSMYVNIIITYDIGPVKVAGVGILKRLAIIFKNSRESARKKFKETGNQIYDLLQARYKTYGNSIYGINADVGFRLYSPEDAAIIAKYGREMLEDIRKFATHHKKEVIYGDTDSVFMKDIDEKFIEELNNYLFSEYGEYFEVKIDSSMKIFQLSDKKKRYIGLTEENKLYTKGWLKGNIPIIVRICSEEFALNIFTNESVLKDPQSEEARVEMLKEYNRQLHKIKTEQNITMFKKHVEISKSLDSYVVRSEHVVAAQNANEILGFEKYNENNSDGFIHIKLHGKKSKIMFENEHELELMREKAKIILDREKYAKMFKKHIRLLFSVHSSHRLATFFK